MGEKAIFNRNIVYKMQSSIQVMNPSVVHLVIICREGKKARKLCTIQCPFKQTPHPGANTKDDTKKQVMQGFKRSDTHCLICSGGHLHYAHCSDQRSSRLWCDALFGFTVKLLMRAHVWNLGCAMRCLYFSGPATAEAEIFKNCSGFREELITTVACARGSTATTCCVILLIVLVVLTILVIRQIIKGSRVWNHRETPINNLANCCHSSVRTYPSSKS